MDFRRIEKELKEMTKQEEKKLKEVIKYIEKLEAECFQEEIKATDRIAKLYYLGAQHNIWYCLDKIKKEFNIKD